MLVDVSIRPTTKATRIYIWPKGETLAENLMNRRFRPVDEYKKVVIPELIRKGFIRTDHKLRWSQKAGCTMCPCSPGFIVNASLGYDVHVNYTADIPEPAVFIPKPTGDDNAK